METFIKEFEKQLRIAINVNPVIYNLNTENDLAGVIAKYRKLLQERSNGFSISGIAMKATFKVLNIKNTYKDLYRFIDDNK